MKYFFTKHPHRMGESYCQHLCSSLKFSFKMLLGGMACLIHAICPCLFEKTGSNFLFAMMKDYISRSPTSDERVIELKRLLDKTT